MLGFGLFGSFFCLGFLWGWVVFGWLFGMVVIAPRGFGVSQVSRDCFLGGVFSRRSWCEVFLCPYGITWIFNSFCYIPCTGEMRFK